MEERKECSGAGGAGIGAPRKARSGGRSKATSGGMERSGSAQSPHTGHTRQQKKMGRMTMHAPQKKKKNLKALEAIADYPTNTERIHDVPYKFIEEDCKENAKDSPAEYFYKKERH